MDWRALGLGLAFVTMWSSAFSSARIVVASAPPFLALSARFAISGLLALAVGWTMGQRFQMTRAQWGGVVIFGLCQNALYLGLYFEAMRTIEASVAVIVASMLPLFVAMLGRIIFGEQLTASAYAGLAAGFAGVLVIMTGRLDGGADAYGIVLALVGVLALSVATLVVRGVSGGGNLWMVVGLQMLVGSIALFPLAWALEDWRVKIHGPKNNH